MLHDLSKKNSLANVFLAELRDAAVQTDRMRFRQNLIRLGEIFAYELSKKLEWEDVEVTTPLGMAPSKQLTEQPVLATILRAGLPLHQGMNNFFDRADSAFISAYRKHQPDGSFEIAMQYVTSPELTNRTLIVCDPMIATGSSMVLTLKELLAISKPKKVHVVCAIAAQQGVDYLKKKLPGVDVWTAAVDEELTAKSYIVPGLGDAGDLSFGAKLQD